MSLRPPTVLTTQLVDDQDDQKAQRINQRMWSRGTLKEALTKAYQRRNCHPLVLPSPMDGISHSTLFLLLNLPLQHLPLVNAHKRITLQTTYQQAFQSPEQILFQPL